MRTSLETCENCDRVIGKLETAFLHDDHVVCSACKVRLEKEGKAETPDPVQPTQPIPLQYSQPASPYIQPMPVISQNWLVVTPRKSRGVYIILGLFFGCLGIHNFYAGYNSNGAAQLLITVLLGWIFGIGVLITALWVLIDICTIKIDANGEYMT